MFSVKSEAQIVRFEIPLAQCKLWDVRSTPSCSFFWSLLNAISGKIEDSKMAERKEKCELLDFFWKTWHLGEMASVCSKNLATIISWHRWLIGHCLIHVEIFHVLWAASTKLAFLKVSSRQTSRLFFMWFSLTTVKRSSKCSEPKNNAWFHFKSTHSNSTLIFNYDYFRQFLFADVEILTYEAIS